MNAKSEQGFTLVELLVAMVILGIIFGAIAASLLAGTRNVDTANYRLVESHDAQIASLYFVTDMQSADSVQDETSSDTSCGGANPLVRFVWIGWDVNPPIRKVAAYRVEEPGGGTDERRLVRIYCEGPSSVTEITRVVIAHNLKPGGGATDPVVVCATTVNGALGADCDGTDIAVAELTASADSENPRDDTFFSYVLRATRRRT